MSPNPVASPTPASAGAPSPAAPQPKKWYKNPYYIVGGIVLILLLGCGGIWMLVSNTFNPGGAVAPTITTSASGHHLYSTLHGGYSLDYPSSWTYPLQSGSFNPLMVLGASIIPRNEQLDLVLLSVGDDKTVSLGFADAYQNATVSAQNCSVLAVRQVLEGKDYNSSESNAGTAQWVTWGSTSGCFVYPINNEDGTPQYAFSGQCPGASLPTFAMTNATASDLQQVISSLRCGPDAVK